MRVLAALLKKEFLQIRRDKQILAMLLVLPVMQLVILANAATYEVKEARFALVDEDRSEASRALTDAFRAADEFRLAAVHRDPAAADAELAAGRVRMVLHVPRHFGRDLARDGRAAVRTVYDAVDGATAVVLRSYAETILHGFAAGRSSSLAVAAAGTAAGGGAAGGGMRVAPRFLFNPELRYPSFMVPGILVELVTMVGLLLSALNIVREREIGTIEQLNVTPIRRWQLIVGKLLPFWLLGLAALTVGLLVGRLLFHVPMRGSLLLLFALIALYLLVMLGMGLWISAVSATQQEATFLALFVLLVFILLSGLFTPLDAMPRWAWWLAQCVPLSHAIEIVRRIMLAGAGPDELAYHVAWLVGMAAVVLPVAVGRYRKVGE